MKSCNSYLGTEQPYLFPKGIKYTLPPKGYKPIYINHLGRHGARYLTSKNGILEFRKVLEEASRVNMITFSGKQLDEKLQKLLEIYKGKYGLLTSLGKREQENLAMLMYKLYPHVFGRQVRAVSTYVTRAKESMDAFMSELAKYTSPRNFELKSNGKVDPLLRFFDLNEAYIDYKKNGRWQEELKVFEQRKDVSTEFLETFFKPCFVETLENKNELSNNLYEIYANQFNTGVHLGLKKYFTTSYLRYYWENNNVRNYLEKGPSNIGQDLPTDIAFALLRNFLETTQEALDMRNLSADLRFAHAETLIPFASILEIRGMSEQSNNMDEVSCTWQDQKVSPMAGNVYWIIYEKESCKEVLIKMIYNGIEVPFPIESKMKPYYNWDSILHFYTKKLEQLPVPDDISVIKQVKMFNVS